MKLIQIYQESWVHDFNKIKEVMKERLWDVAIQIEHIGSTAVKNLAAKPIIDIDIVYDKNTSFEAIKNRLETLGYYHHGDQGINGREVFKRNTLNQQHPVLDTIKHHLYVCHIENEELQRHLVFRDYLIKHEQERKAYEQLKYKIAQMANQDRKVYAALKEIMAKAFIASILEKAKEKKV